jgi:hypothetical protein
MSGPVTWSFTTATTQASAVFLKQDSTTKGNWIGTYGTLGYDLINSASSLPSNVTVTAAGQSTYTWANPSTSTSALEVPPNGRTRIAACWYSSSSFAVLVNAGSSSYDLELYVLDYDSGNRAEQIQFTNAATGAVLSTEAVTSFTGGAYLNWAITGNVRITITNSSNENAVLSGLFFDPTQVAAAVSRASTAGGATNVRASSVITTTASDKSTTHGATAGVKPESGGASSSDAASTDSALSSLAASAPIGALPEAIFDSLASVLVQSKSKRS